MIHCRACVQFRPVRHAEPARYHTRTAAGINSASHRAPPKIAARPRTMSITAAPVDFFESALIGTAEGKPGEDADEDNSMTLRLLTVKLSLVALEADARHTQANQSKGEQNLPVGCSWLVTSRAHNAEREL
jgi:hypothetical protein